MIRILLVFLLISGCFDYKTPKGHEEVTQEELEEICKRKGFEVDTVSNGPYCKISKTTCGCEEITKEFCDSKGTILRKNEGEIYCSLPVNKGD